MNVQHTNSYYIYEFIGTPDQIALQREITDEEMVRMVAEGTICLLMGPIFDHETDWEI